MENYYEYLELDMTASEEEIRISVNKMSAHEAPDLQKLREVKSILLNEQARKIYDEKLISHILNKGKKSIILDSTVLKNMFSPDNIVLHNKFIWTAVVLFILNILSDFIFGLNVNLVISTLVMLLTLVALWQDWKLLQKLGFASFSVWWVLISPVYLFRRSKAVGTDKKFFILWMAIIVFYVLVKVVFSNGTTLLERSACGVVTDIYHSQFRQYSLSCKSVTITESNGKTHYGFAEISDGSSREVTVTERQDGKIYVRVE